MVFLMLQIQRFLWYLDLLAVFYRKIRIHTLTRMMLDKLTEMDINIKYELLTAGHVQINHCRGCWSCMRIGKCPLDEIDDVDFLKQKMVDSDFIIWGSPVYTMRVSGQMKTFLDRLASWYI